jgi:hypothetical protein
MFNATSQNWEYVGFDLFVDKASKVRKGDIAAIQIKSAQLVATFEIDCKNNRFIDNRMNDFKDPAFDKIKQIACANSYKFWN